MNNINSDIFKIQSNNVLPSRGKILISEPFLCDATFGRSVVLLVDHTDEGSMGLIMNKQLPLLVNDVIKEFKYLEDIPLYKGGPIGTDTLFYLHTLPHIPEELINRSNAYRQSAISMTVAINTGDQRKYLADCQRRSLLSTQWRSQRYVEKHTGKVR